MLINFLEYSKLPDDNDIDNDDHEKEWERECERQTDRENRELAFCLQENRTEYKTEEHLLR